MVFKKIRKQQDNINKIRKQQDNINKIRKQQDNINKIRKQQDNINKIRKKKLKWSRLSLSYWIAAGVCLLLNRSSTVV